MNLRNKTLFWACKSKECLEVITIIYGCGSMLTEPPQFGPLGGEPLGYYHCPTDDGFARLVAVPDLWKDSNSMKEFIVAATLVYRDTTLFNTKITWTGIPETVATATLVPCTHHCGVGQSGNRKSPGPRRIPGYTCNFYQVLCSY